MISINQSKYFVGSVYLHGQTPKRFPNGCVEGLVAKVVLVLQLAGIGAGRTISAIRAAARRFAKTTYFEDGWLCNFLVDVSSSNVHCTEEFSTPDIRAFPAELIAKVRQHVGRSVQHNLLIAPPFYGKTATLRQIPGSTHTSFLRSCRRRAHSTL